MYDETDRPRRTFGHSLYATFVRFTMACFVLTFLSDLAYWATASMTWETFSVWLLAVGLFVGGCAIPAGILDVVRSRRVRGLEQPLLAVVGHVVAFSLSIVNVLVHSRDGYTAVVPQGLILSALVVLVVLATTLKSRSAVPRSRIGGLA